MAHFKSRRNNANLPGMGGVFNHINGNLYHYGGNNPVHYIDPDGEKVFNKSAEYVLIRTEDSGYVILPPYTTYNGKDVKNYDYNSNDVDEIDMGKIDGVIKSNGDILKVSDSQDTVFKSFLPDVDVKISKDGKMSIDGPISNKINSEGDKEKAKNGRDDMSGCYKVGDKKGAGTWLDRKPSQEKMKNLSTGKQYFIEKDIVEQILEDEK